MNFIETLEELDDYNKDNTEFFSLNGETHLAKIIKCYDGDTIHCIFKHNDTYQKFRIRMFGYDSPEMRPSKKIKKSIRLDIKSRAKLAKRALEDIILHKIVIIECMEFDKYGRLLAGVRVNKDDEKTVNEMMVELGHGKEYYGGKK